MRKPAAILAGTAIFLGGCRSSHHSDTWRKVVATPHPGPEAVELTRPFAADLHKTLLHAHVPHKVVTAEFQYRGDYKLYGTTRRTVVVYRDTSRRGESWWLMDERLNVPFWLPNEPLDRQITFYLGRSARLVDVSDFTGPDAAKIILPEDKGPRKSGVTHIERVTSTPPPAPKKAAKPVPPPKPAPKAETKIVPVEKSAPKPAPKVVEKPVTKEAPKPMAKPVEKKVPAEKPVAKTEAKPSTKPAPAPALADKPRPKKAAKPAEKPVASVPWNKPERWEGAGPLKPLPADEPKAKPPEKPAKLPPAPAVIAQPGDKPPKKPSLFDKSSGPESINPQDAPDKKRESDETPKPADSPKSSFLSRFFRRLFRA
jgi:hypothetical protein